MAELKQTIGLTAAVSLVVGSVIGSGIFMKPAVMASQLGSPLLLISVWIVAGLITLCGALSNAEVASMFPQTGGQYVFFKEMYGDAFAFLYGWAAFAVFNTGGVASIAYIFSEYTTYFIHLPRFPEVTEKSISFHIPAIGTVFPLANIGVKLLAIGLISLFSAVNYISAKYGSRLQTLLTALKAAAIAFLIGGILFSGKGSVHNFVTSSTKIVPNGGALFSAYMAALAGAFWAYDGWNNITFVAGEIKEPQRNVPRSLFIGVTVVILIYSLVNLSYIYVLPIDSMAASNLVSSDAATVAWGVAGGSLIALLVMLSTLGTANGNILSIARVTFAMNTESSWFTIAGKVQSRYKTPGNALIINAVWTIILIITGSFDILTDMVVFVSWFFYGSSALGVFILRKKYPGTHRPYTVWGYPFIPSFFVLFTLFFLVFTLYTDVQNYASGNTVIINSVLGIFITCLGLPIYFLSKKNKNVV